ncbi:cupin domain-containing protein [Rhizobium grahamii]|uniref:Cupin domain-containing protein n=1 Tax=Rhizobium grahamii TaxID=1120045 RepID=A0A5Q0C8I0_9HYPH|nr:MULTISPECIES: cupin domain-containing protein [Rhizobium]QFY60201.1 cupin domain-containing protein [Rhizobium grahamii]QRM50676.1 cupin domain-containing protein [Rhizobium sp. BG6]
MTIQMSHSKSSEEIIKIPAIGLELSVRVDPSTTGGQFCFIDTINAPGFGPPRHRHRETEVFRVMEGRYLFEVDGRQFYAEEGDVVTVPGGAAHAFVNVTDRPARQYILIEPGLDAKAFFLGLADVMRDGRPDTAALNVFARTWDVEFLGPPLTVPREG